MGIIVRYINAEHARLVTWIFDTQIKLRGWRGEGETWRPFIYLCNHTPNSRLQARSENADPMLFWYLMCRIGR